MDPDGLDGNGDAAIHCFVRRQRGEKQMFSCLMAMLIHSRCDVDLPNANGDSALHLAADVSACATTCHPCMQAHASRPTRACVHVLILQSCLGSDIHGDSWYALYCVVIGHMITDQHVHSCRGRTLGFPPTQNRWPLQHEIAANRIDYALHRYCIPCQQISSI